MRHIAWLVLAALGCGEGGDCDPETATTQVFVHVANPSGEALDDATVELNGEGCAGGQGGDYDCGTAPEGEVEVLAIHPLFGSKLERTEVVPCDTPELEFELSLDNPMGL